jgi:hypothetical protein
MHRKLSRLCRERIYLDIHRPQPNVADSRSLRQSSYFCLATRRCTVVAVPRSNGPREQSPWHSQIHIFTWDEIYEESPPPSISHLYLNLDLPTMFALLPWPSRLRGPQQSREHWGVQGGSEARSLPPWRENEYDFAPVYLCITQDLQEVGSVYMSTPLVNFRDGWMACFACSLLLSVDMLCVVPAESVSRGLMARPGASYDGRCGAVRRISKLRWHQSRKRLAIWPGQSCKYFLGIPCLS